MFLSSQESSDRVLSPTYAGLRNKKKRAYPCFASLAEKQQHLYFLLSLPEVQQQNSSRLTVDLASNPPLLEAGGAPAVTAVSRTSFESRQRPFWAALLRFRCRHIIPYHVIVTKYFARGIIYILRST